MKEASTMARKVLKTLIAAAVALAALTTAYADEPAPILRVVLLGTGTPSPSAERFGPATLVQAGGLNLLFDAGRGNTIRLTQAKVPLGKIDQVFLTHFHSDHVNGLSDLWMTAWLPAAYAGRKTPLGITGPTGLKALTDALVAAFANNEQVRIADEKLQPEGIRFDVHEFAEGHDGVVFERDGVKVTAFKNDHGALIHPSVGYRIDYRGHAVLLSGDTRKSDNLIKHAKGVDLLIHEVAAVKPELLKQNPVLLPIIDHHTTPQEAGSIFSTVRPKLAVYTHFVLLAGPGFPAPTSEDILSATRETYDGPLVLGEDLMAFEISDAVKVVPWNGAR
jgi:ribonuclease Z